jgi:ferrous iron transport protein B
MSEPLPNTFRLALVGAPNCGKTALFNLLTGSRQKVANYAGVTVERKEGRFALPGGEEVRVLDLPGAYSLHAASPDEEVTREVVVGERSDEPVPDLLVCVVDANNLRLHLRLVLELRELGVPMVVVLNMMDAARARGLRIDRQKLEARLEIPVVECVAIQRGGADALIALVARFAHHEPTAGTLRARTAWRDPDQAEVRARLSQVRAIVRDTCDESSVHEGWGQRIDAVVMHPLGGLLLLAVVLFVMFQAVFSWAQAPMDLIKSAVAGIADLTRTTLPPGPLRSLLADGIISGAGNVLVFLPQIMILFAFILALEDSGYLPRAAFLLDRLMGVAGLSGRAFIPLLSSFACAIPGIMATRTIPNPRDRLATIMIAPLMTCSARIPVYALLISAFVPARELGWGLQLQGLVLFGLYMAGILAGLAVALVIRLAGRGQSSYQPLLLELPAYRLPAWRNLLIGLWERMQIFITRVGTIILALMVLLWFLSSYPGAPADATGPAIQYSYAGIIGSWLGILFAPIGFNWQIAIALVPGLAAREVAVGALGTVYALSATSADTGSALAPMLAHSWSLPTALSLLAWYVFAPQCVATLGVVKRETNSWRQPTLMAAYLFALAYLGSFTTYHAARWMLAGLT